MWNSIGTSYASQGKFGSALDYFVKTLQQYEKIWGSNRDHEDTARSLLNIGECYREMKNYKLALVYLEKSLNMRIKSLGKRHPDTATAYVNLSMTLKSLQEYKQAKVYAKCGLAIRQDKLPADNQDLIDTKQLIAELDILLQKR